MDKLPEQFSDLQEFVPEFGISDDVLRDESERKARPELLRRFVDTMSPRLEEINSYLDHHNDEPACLLGTLAEAACEVAIEIGWPSRTNLEQSRADT
jgi:hypothetical protein